MTPDLLIVGGGTGGCAAALTACSLGLRVVMTDPYPWVGGQLTSQCVPPDENPWIEEGGCTASYAEFRDRVRDWYRTNGDLTEEASSDPALNPGGGWVSKLCHRPDVAHKVLLDMLDPFIEDGSLEVMTGWRPVACKMDRDKIVSVGLCNDTGAQHDIAARFVLDATETGELLPLCDIEYVVGAESQSETDEPHAIVGSPEKDNIQGLTWCAVIGVSTSDDNLIKRPEQYDRWRSLQPKGWPCDLLSFKMLHVQRGHVIDFPLFGNNGFNLFTYRQIVDAKNHASRVADATVMNWPMNDYYMGSVLDTSEESAQEHYRAAKQLTLSMLYWLQTEATRHDGGTGYPEITLRPDLTGTQDGLAMAPYIRESRRICPSFLVKEQHVVAEAHPGRSLATQFWDSVGIGAYRIDLHPSTNERPTIDLSSLPFQIPLGSLVPINVKNLVPACKNIGVTHITNGCYRLHPVEWNVGEAAAALAYVCLECQASPVDVYAESGLVRRVQQILQARGVPLSWDGFETRAL